MYLNILKLGVDVTSLKNKDNYNLYTTANTYNILKHTRKCQIEISCIQCKNLYKLIG